MNRLIFCFFLVVTGAINFSFAAQVDSLSYGAFDKIYLYKPLKAPQSVALIVSGNAGWDLNMKRISQDIVAQGAVVAGIDMQHYMKKAKILAPGCYYPAADFEALSMFLQKKLKIHQYLKPILVGYSTGATLVYATLAQAPSNTFRGAVSFGFSPVIKTDKPLCDGDALKSHTVKDGNIYKLEASDKINTPFVFVQIEDKTSYSVARNFIRNTKKGELISIPQGVDQDWNLYISSAYQKVLQTKTDTEQIILSASSGTFQNPLPKNLPLYLIPSGRDTIPLAIFISGDGGWTSFDQSVCREMAKGGVPVVGLDAQKYFWEKKTVEQTTSDISQIALYYMQQWKRKSFILVGYSFGASVIPFIANRFSPSVRGSLRETVALSPDEKGDFEIHVSDMLNFGNSNDIYDVINEINQLKGIRMLCIFGKEESENVRNNFMIRGIEVITLPGNHHYNNNYKIVASTVIKSFHKK